MNRSVRFSYLLIVLSCFILSCQTNTRDGVDLNPTEFKAAMDKERSAIILDVRTPQEVAKGIIPGAITIDFYSDTFKKELRKLDKNKTYFVYCKSGRRSGKTYSILQDEAILNVYNLKGGITAWKEAGLEIVQK